MSDLFDKKHWIELAKSDDTDSREQALELASTWSNLLQLELLYWFACNTNFEARFQIFQFLDKEHRSLALRLINDKEGITSFDRTLSFDEFERAQDIEMQGAIIHLERWFAAPDERFKNSLYLEYKNRKRCSMEDSKLAVNLLFTEDPEQIGDDAAGESRSDE